jgi:nucleoside-diphosphate-sugar epimerase
MRVFVTGGTGFIGSHVLKAMSQKNWEVSALRTSQRSIPRIALDSQPYWLDGQMDGIECEQLRGVDCLVHLAAAGVVTSGKKIDLFDVNVSQSFRLWKTALDAGVRKFLICGSCFEYGRSGEEFDFLPPDAPLKPVTAYAASKAAATMIGIGLAITYGASVKVVRPFQVFGPGEAYERFWPSLCKAATSGNDFPMSKGEQIRDFVQVEDVAAEIVESCDSWELPFSSYSVSNIGSGKPQSLLEFCEYWWQKLGAKGDILPGKLSYRIDEVMRYVPQIGNPFQFRCDNSSS